MRLDYNEIWPAAQRAMMALEKAVHGSGLDWRVAELVKIRASQLNGCAYCLDMHLKDARALGEDQARLDLVAAWRDAECFTERERAALEWCESLTLLADTGAPDESYDAVAAVFDAEEQVALTLAIVAINGWNRLNVGFRTPPGDYVSRHLPSSG